MIWARAAPYATACRCPLGGSRFHKLSLLGTSSHGRDGLEVKFSGGVRLAIPKLKAKIPFERLPSQNEIRLYEGGRSSPKIRGSLRKTFRQVWDVLRKRMQLNQALVSGEAGFCAVP
jgi:hypothetical protein